MKWIHKQAHHVTNRRKIANDDQHKKIGIFNSSTKIKLFSNTNINLGFESNNHTGLYFAFFHNWNPKRVDPWKLIPGDAFAVLQIKKADKVWDEAKDSEVLEKLRGFKFFDKNAATLEALQSVLSKADYNLFDLLGDEELLQAVLRKYNFF